MAAKRLLGRPRELRSWTTKTSSFHQSAARPTRAYEQRRGLNRTTGISDRRQYDEADAEFSWIDDRRFTPVPRHEVASSIPKPNLRVSTDSIEVLQRYSGRYVKIPGIWFRDNCACHECRNADTAQRKINVFKKGIDCEIANVARAGDADGPMFKVTFRDGHTSTFTEEFVSNSRDHRTEMRRNGNVPMALWNHDIGATPPTVQYAETQSSGLGPLLLNLRKYGFCFVEGIDASPKATERFLSSIGPITNTHYGGFYDFTADLSSKDTAYTNESLEPHNDNTYFTAAAGLQALHLLSHTEGSGGESSLVDGFGVAQKLFIEDKAAYSALSRIPIWGHASGNDGISIQSAQARPVLKHATNTRALIQVTWNNADRAGVAGGLDSRKKWYDAAAKFDARVNDPKNQYWFRLEPGKLLIFDNWRILHGRAAFTGKRRMCGGYIARDDFISKFKATNMTPEEIQASTVTG